MSIDYCGSALRGAFPGEGRLLRDPKYFTREGWLMAAVDLLRPEFAKRGQPLGKVRVAHGFPTVARALGECWADSVSRDATREIFTTPACDNAADLLFILTHELVHAALPAGVGHGRPWAKLAESFGMVHGPGGTYVGNGGPAFKLFCEPLLWELGPFPHASMNIGRPGSGVDGWPGLGGIGGGCGGSRTKPKAKQQARLRLWECDCNPKPVKVRVASDHFEAHCDHCGSAFHPPED